MGPWPFPVDEKVWKLLKLLQNLVLHLSFAEGLWMHSGYEFVRGFPPEIEHGYSLPIHGMMASLPTGHEGTAISEP